MGRLIRDGNQVYEIDEECIREKERKEHDWQTQKTEEEGYNHQPQKRNHNGRMGNRFPFGR
ncbi:MAG: hypothetical protein HFG80_14760 [Eubacterium sp.]|nr:hypothetical protein [Eubacterium sp.]